MRIAIVNSHAPFIRGGAEFLADSLKAKLQEHGHEVEVIRIPFKWYPIETLIRNMVANRWIKLPPGWIDLVIGFKFPAYYIPFPNKKIWLLHQFRQAYDLWGTKYQDIPDTPEGHRVRDMIIKADNTYLAEAKEIYTISHNVAGRLKKFNQIEATGVLYPPVLNPELFWCDQAENYFFYPSRLVTSKRQELAIEAMRHVKSDFKLILAGKPDTPAYGDELRAKVERYHLQDRVKFAGFVSDEQKAELIAKSVACLNLPYDEDYGYVTVEAFHGHKPIISLKDGGAINEIVEHESNGLVVEPTAESLADAMEQLWSNKKKAAQLGDAGNETIAKHSIHWDYALEKLLR